MLESYLDIESVKLLNELMDSSLSVSNIKKMFMILNNACDGFTIINNGFNIWESLIHGFFLNEKINSKENFDEIISKMSTIEFDKHHLGKIKSIVSVGKTFSDLDNKEYNKIMNALMDMPNDYYDNYRILDMLMDIPDDYCDSYEISNIIPKNHKKISVILDVLLNNKINCGSLNGGDERPYLLKFLNYEGLISLSDEEYKDIITYGLTYSNWYFLNKLIDSGLPSTKIKYAIDYYKKLDKYIIKYSTYTLDGLERDFRISSILHLPINPKYVSLSDEEYLSVLNEVVSSKDCIAYAKVKNSNHLTKEREDFVLDVINSDNNANKSDENSQKNVNFNSLGDIALSYTAMYLSIAQYKEIINYAKECLISGSNDLSAKLEDIKSLFVKSPFYVDNLERLDFLINFIKNEKDRYVVSEIIKIFTDINSVYYTDEELIKLIDFMRYSYKLGYKENDKINQDKYFVLKYLFINNNVPFMDRKKLIEEARINDKAEVCRLTEYYNKLGFMNITREALVHGLENSVLLEKEKAKRLTQIH